MMIFLSCLVLLACLCKSLSFFRSFPVQRQQHGILYESKNWWDTAFQSPSSKSSSSPVKTSTPVKVLEKSTSKTSTPLSKLAALASVEIKNGVPTRGLIDYIGKTFEETYGDTCYNLNIPSTEFTQTKFELFWTKFNLWRQLPWKKIDGKAVIKIKLEGSLPLEPSPPSGLSLGSPPNLEAVTSLSELTTLLNYAAYDPRIKGIFVEMGSINAGYAKLQELSAEINTYRKSGKPIIAFSEGASEKELYLAQSFDSFYMPPDGALDIRGFSGGAQFFRGIFEKIGIEPQVQRIGKYKSFGDTFNRTSIAEAQREVISSLITEASQHWIETISSSLGKSASEVQALWSEEGVKTPYSYLERGYISGVRYVDQVEKMVGEMFSEKTKESKIVKIVSAYMSRDSKTNGTTVPFNDTYKNFDLAADFEYFPRRSSTPALEFKNKSTLAQEQKLEMKKNVEELIRKERLPEALAGGLYLKKMRKGARILKGLPLQEVRAGPRIAVINAVGGISSGESSSGNPLNGPTVGSVTLTKLIRRAKADASIKAVVLRVDSPGGSALASDIMWREIRSLSREKPVVASQVDVAASGGFYLSMACDQIVSNELTVTGSIGVVTSKFNAEKLNDKIGLTGETVSIGRYAELFRTDRGFTDDENSVFEDYAQDAYQSFVSKAAISRDMSYEALNEVAQGRVWTGLGKTSNPNRNNPNPNPNPNPKPNPDPNPDPNPTPNLNRKKASGVKCWPR